MVRLLNATDATGIPAWNAVLGTGRFSRRGSIGLGAGGNGSGTDLQAITEGSIAKTDASLTEQRERRLSEVPLQSCE
jgi:hypothetical protein